MIKLKELLQEFQEALIDRALDQLNEAKLLYYDLEKNMIRQRVVELFELTIRSMVERSADPVVDHARRIARERFAAGYDLSEVQTSINILKEVVCARVVASLEPDEAADPLGGVTAIFSVTKDTLACPYVELAGKKP